MAEGKISSGTAAGAALGTFALGIVGTYLNMSDTSPKSLEQIADALSQIAAVVDTVDSVDADTAETASAILLKASEIGVSIVEKSTEVELESVSGIILNEDKIHLDFGESVAIEMRGKERVALTFHFSGRNYLQLYVDGVLRNFRAGERVWESANTGCFLELTDHDTEAPSLAMISVCPLLEQSQ